MKGLVERFWPKVNKNGSIPSQRPDLGPCWEWTAAKTQGYGVISKGGRGNGNLRAHRVAYQLVIGTILVGYELDHLCRNPSCVNPSHLELVSHRENELRGKAPCAANARKTHCPNGHPYDDSNTYLYQSRKKNHPARQCKVCRHVHTTKWNVGVRERKYQFGSCARSSRLGAIPESS